MLLLGQRNIRRVKAQVVANSLSKNEVMLLKLMSEFHACTVVTHLHILLPSHVALDVVESVQFGTLMEAIEEFTVGSKYRDS